ncbi:unnamed protein product [Paramecium primaurelia]|uniref:Uncharacterized protein n=1 Tax=Paramecium primaurelia TaxID=5886 RepID=A0A8S1NS71_PARPR|nr:unnamed protein product [Paramecium primaurelia]
MKPNMDLFIQLFYRACLLYNKYVVQKNREQYGVYFTIDMLQWEIINNLKNECEQNLEEIILQIEKTHEKLVKNSKNWKNHFLWIQMIGKILIYILNSSFNLEEKWKEYLKKGVLIQMNHSNDQALNQLNEFNNKELTQVDKLIVEDTFKEWENLILLKDFLMKVKKNNIEKQENSYIQTVLKIQQFQDFSFSNNLLALIQKNCDSLGVIVKNYKNFIKKHNYYNVTLEQATYNSQIKKMIINFKEYFQNTKLIIKILELSLSEQHFQMEQLEQKKMNEFTILYQLKYFMRLLELILSQTIQDINDQRNEPDKSIILQQEISLSKSYLTCLMQLQTRNFF